MGRTKSAAPRRLPRDPPGSPSDHTPAKHVSLAAYEIRLASDVAENDLAQFGKRSGGDFVLVDDDQVALEQAQAGAEDHADDGVDGEQAKLPNKLFEAYLRPFNVCLSGPGKEEHCAICLANIVLDLMSEESSRVVFIFRQVELCDRSRNLTVRLVRHEQRGMSYLDILDAKAEEVLFRGSAEYWLGADEEQLEALAVLVRRKSLFVPAEVFVRPSDGHIIVKFAFHVSKEGFVLEDAVADTLEEGLLSKTPQSRFWGSKHTLIVMEWIFPGSVSKFLGQPKQVLSLDYANHKENRMPGAMNEGNFKFDPAKLFSYIRPSKTRKEVSQHLIPAELTSTLRPYQKRAVQWMLERENFYEKDTLNGKEVDVIAKSFYCQYLAADGTPFHFNPFNGRFVVIDPEKAMKQESFVKSIKGGILGDEMGLGKTVETITLILANREKDTLPDPFLHADYTAEQQTRKPTDEIKCFCNHGMNELPGGWVECCQCGAWQHALCTLYEPNEGESPNHVCFDCRCAGVKGKADDIQRAKTTLIICPSSIFMQWESEIAKHTKKDSLSILLYEGVRATMAKAEPALKNLLKTLSANRKRRRKTNEIEPNVSEETIKAMEEYKNIIKVLYPPYVASHDVVVTTYEVLRTDLHHAQKATQRDVPRLRHKKKYCSAPSPLSSIHWRRICLDEAQEVESSAAAAAEMALSLRSTFRWCVTGTPVGRGGLSDLYGLILFLRVRPLWLKAWWTRAITSPLEFGHNSAVQRLVAVFRHLLWRNTKQYVRDELHVPTLMEHIHYLDFNQLERHFYDKQHQQVQLETFSSKKSGSDNIASFVPLLRLRQACCHPQIGTFGLQGGQGGLSNNAGNGRKRRRNNKANNKVVSATDDNSLGRTAHAPMQMIEIHKLLLDKAKLECEEAQRLYFMNCHAVAGIKLLMNKSEEAREIYQNVIHQMDDNESKQIAKADALQRLHALQGLMDIVVGGSSASNAGTTSLTKDLHIERMKNQINKIREKYLNRYALEVDAAFQECGKLALNDFTLDVPCQGLNRFDQWWALALKSIQRANDGQHRGEMLVERIRMDRASGGAVNPHSHGLASSIHHFSSVGIVVQTELEKITKAHDEMCKSLILLAKPPTEAEVRENANCSVCRDYLNRTGPICATCKQKRALTKLENLLYSLTREMKNKRQFTNVSGITEEDEQSSYQFRMESEVKVILRLLKAAVKPIALSGIDGLLEACDQHLGYLDQMTTKLRSGFLLWRKKDAQLKAFDELDMATLRMQRREPDEEIAEGEDQWKILEIEMPVKLQDYELEVARYRNQLKQSVHQLKFLENIKTGGASNISGRVLNTTTITQDGEQVESCPICHDPLGQKKSVSVLPCGHTLCPVCVGKLARYGNKCPNCRARFKPHEIRYGKVGLESNNENHRMNANNDANNRENNTSSGSGSSNSSSNGTDNAAVGKDEDFVQVKGDLGTKFEAVIRQVMLMETNDPTEKCLIFSQWEQVLDILEHGLIVNEISYTRLQGKHRYNERLALFRRDPSIRVLLLPIKSGAKGLNLTEASRVFFVEPVMGSAIVAQAIGRISRMGQKRERIHVHHFIVTKTIEERIHQMFHGSKKNQANQDATSHEVVADDEYTTLNVLSKEKEVITLEEMKTLFS